MKINMIHIPVRDLIKGYSEDDATSKVVAWDGRLDVRPEYQREFVYDEVKRDAVIHTILNGFPLNIMYFVDRQDGTYEVLDGQQRIISICRFYTNSFSVKLPDTKGKYNSVNYPNLFDNQEKAFLNYELQVYICDGTEREKLEWFEIINIAGVTLSEQEIRNAIYHSAWLTDAKSVFSRKSGAAVRNYGKYLKGEFIRQKFLETAFIWHADFENFKGKDAIVEYMQKHRFDPNADALWKYFESIFTWVSNVFGKFDQSMKGVDWGLLYNQHKDDTLDSREIQHHLKNLLSDYEVQKKSGIYEYLLTNDEKHLNLRQFEEKDRRQMYDQQHGLCALCKKSFDFKEMHADHVKPWSKGGKTEISNCQMLCVQCNLKKSNH